MLVQPVVSVSKGNTQDIFFPSSNQAESWFTATDWTQSKIKLNLRSSLCVRENNSQYISSSSTVWAEPIRYSDFLYISFCQWSAVFQLRTQPFVEYLDVIMVDCCSAYCRLNCQSLIAVHIILFVVTILISNIFIFWIQVHFKSELQLAAGEVVEKWTCKMCMECFPMCLLPPVKLSCQTLWSSSLNSALLGSKYIGLGKSSPQARTHFFVTINYAQGKFFCQYKPVSTTAGVLY